MNSKRIVSLGMALAAATAAAEDFHARYWNNVALYELNAPTLAAPAAPGLHGRAVAGLDPLTGETAAGDETARTWSARAWRGERVHGQFAVWTDRPRAQLRARPLTLSGEAGTIGADRLSVRFVRYVRADARADVKAGNYGDCLDPRACVDMPANSFRPVWLTVAVPRDAKPGLYRGELALVADAADTVTFPIALEVLPRALPEKTGFYLDLWMMPWSIARYHGVEPYSPMHMELMKPYFRELAAAGQRAIMTHIIDDIWPMYAGKTDTGRSMVDYAIRADGSRSFDFTHFDRFVETALACGVGPQIHCYSVLRFSEDRLGRGFSGTYTDGDTGMRVVRTFEKLGSPDWEAFWGPYLAAIERHAAEKGWLGNVYIALDEMSVPVVRELVAVIGKWAPGLKVQFANDKPYRDFAAFGIENFSQALRKDFMSDDLFADLAGRRAAGKITTFYVCDGHPVAPNTWFSRPALETEWIGLYCAARGFDGFLRWAAFLWNRDPALYADNRHRPGESVYFYPGARASVRWEYLRDAIEDFDKIAVLRREGALTAELAAALGEMRFDGKLPRETYVRQAEKALRALEAVR